MNVIKIIGNVTEWVVFRIRKLDRVCRSLIVSTDIRRYVTKKSVVNILFLWIDVASGSLAYLYTSTHRCKHSRVLRNFLIIRVGREISKTFLLIGVST